MKCTSLGAALLAAAGLLAAPARAADEVELIDRAGPVPLDVEVIESAPERVRYQITNRGPHPVRDVAVLVSHAFLWSDEFSPGADNPSRAATSPVPGELAPGESRQVTYELRPALPERRDGRFDVSVEVLRWTAQLPPVAASERGDPVYMRDLQSEDAP